VDILTKTPSDFALKIKPMIGLMNGDQEEEQKVIKALEDVCGNHSVVGIY